MKNKPNHSESLKLKEEFEAWNNNALQSLLASFNKIIDSCVDGKSQKEAYEEIRDLNTDYLGELATKQEKVVLKYYNECREAGWTEDEIAQLRIANANVIF